MAVTTCRRVFKEDFFDLNKKYLFYVGVWPGDNMNRTELILYKTYEICLHIMALIYLTITSIGTYQNKDNMTIFLTNLDKVLVAYKFSSKVLIFIGKRKWLKTLITEIELSGDKVTEERKRLMRYHVYIVTAIGSAVTASFFMLSQFNNEMMVEAWMPFDPKKNRLNLFIATQFLALTFTVPCLYRSFAMQGIVCSIMMYICDQLVELQNRLKAMEYSNNGSFFRKEMKDIVNKHVRLMGYTKTLKMVFKEFFLVQHIAITFELCLNAIMISVVGSKEKMHMATFLAFLGIALLNAYIYCYLGNELMVQSGGLALAAYEANWTTWPVDLQKDLLLIIQVSQRPLRLSAGGLVDMSIQSFSQALYNGYSVFAVLNDVVD